MCAAKNSEARCDVALLFIGSGMMSKYRWKCQCRTNFFHAFQHLLPYVMLRYSPCGETSNTATVAVTSCDDTCSFATNLKKYYLFTFVAKLHVSSQLRWRPLTYSHRGCRATSQCAFKFLVANVTYKMTPRFFPPKRWNRFFAIYVVRLAL